MWLRQTQPKYDFHQWWWKCLHVAKGRSSRYSWRWRLQGLRRVSRGWDYVWIRSSWQKIVPIWMFSIPSFNKVIFLTDDIIYLVPWLLKYDGWLYQATRRHGLHIRLNYTWRSVKYKLLEKIILTAVQKQLF